MENSAKFLFDSLNNYSDIEKLISEGESEGQFLECKAPLKPKLNHKLTEKLSKAVSGFSNSSGGVVIWGISTVEKNHSKVDQMIQIESIAGVKEFSSMINDKIPTLTEPLVIGFKNKIIKKKKGDTSGIVITLIPEYLGDPVQSVSDNHFWFRIGGSFSKVPYGILKRLFNSTRTPDVCLSFSDKSASKVGSLWRVPIAISNKSGTVGENVTVVLRFSDPSMFDEIRVDEFNDVSDLNLGKNKVYTSVLNKVVHRGLSVVVGHAQLKLNGRKKTADFSVSIYANNMRAKEYTVKVKILKGSFELINITENYIY